jgi:hypothetical protein
MHRVALARFATPRDQGLMAVSDDRAVMMDRIQAGRRNLGIEQAKLKKAADRFADVVVFTATEDAALSPMLYDEWARSRAQCR